MEEILEKIYENQILARGYVSALMDDERREMRLAVFKDVMSALWEIDRLVSEAERKMSEGKP